MDDIEELCTINQQAQPKRPFNHHPTLIVCFAPNSSSFMSATTLLKRRSVSNSNPELKPIPGPKRILCQCHRDESILIENVALPLLGNLFDFDFNNLTKSLGELGKIHGRLHYYPISLSIVAQSHGPVTDQVHTCVSKRPDLLPYLWCINRDYGDEQRNCT